MSTIPQNKIRAFRESHNWTQEELASFMGLSHVAVSRHESAQRMPSDELIARYCLLFGVMSHQLFCAPTSDA